MDKILRFFVNFDLSLNFELVPQKIPAIRYYCRMLALWQHSNTHKKFQGKNVLGFHNLKM